MIDHLQLEEVCRIFASPVDQAAALAAARRRVTDEKFAAELAHVKSWIRAIDAHAKTSGQALTNGGLAKLERPSR
jgi:hypothetical protein